MNLEEIFQWKEESTVEGIGGVGDLELGIFSVGEEIGKIVFQAPIG